MKILFIAISTSLFLLTLWLIAGIALPAETIIVGFPVLLLALIVVCALLAKLRKCFFGSPKTKG